MTLVEFLLARIAEDEAIARAASKGGTWTWDADCVELLSDVATEYGPECIIDTEGGAGPPGEEAGSHIARHDPARVLAECQARRRIVNAWMDPFGQWAAGEADAARAQKNRTLQLLAAVYADHPDYDEAWKC